MVARLDGHDLIRSRHQHSCCQSVGHRRCLLRDSFLGSSRAVLGSWSGRAPHRYETFQCVPLRFHMPLQGISQYTNPCHLARATLEANAFQTRAIIESMKLDSGSDLKHLKVDGGMTNGDLAMSILADIGGFSVVRPEMRE